MIYFLTPCVPKIHYTYNENPQTLVMHEFNHLSSFQKNKDQDKDSSELLFSVKEYIIKTSLKIDLYIQCWIFW